MVLPIVVNKNFISVDPGMHTAVQLWEDGKPSTSYTISTKMKTTGEVIYDITDKFYSILNADTCIDVMIIEAMDVRAGDSRSMASAGRGNLSRLAYIIGALICAAEMNKLLVAEPVIYSKWAGQLNYGQLRFILENKFAFKASNDHEAAAFGIGLWALGKL